MTNMGDTPTENELDVRGELEELVGEEWRLHPFLSLAQVIRHLPEPQRSRANDLLKLLEEGGRQ
jgi:hypothetical protein